MLKKGYAETGYIRVAQWGDVCGYGKIVGVQKAGKQGADVVVEIIAEAFADDPVWSWVFDQASLQKRYWSLFIHAANRHKTVFMTSGNEAVSVWIPPLGKAFLPEDDVVFEKIINDLPKDRIKPVSDFLENFDNAHPRSEPHYYLGLLGVQNHFRGLGIGMALLQENLRRIDAEAMPAYLESSNQANNTKYETVGFEPITSFQVPDNGPVVTGMWRKAREN